ncbi:hypothetical protein DPMN_004753 [Dreissena polymorpha]|uniref:Uncharacterized protein n=1 Tax=Dreissena polymorpha TaxID=45954 RepID=A0A9D4RT93_DREPO|nr:hypothetical protein DPMN_004753 [Dreissena polymorpha]
MQLLKANGITPLFVPAACTDPLQPLDLSVNYEYKQQLKQCFHDWYCKQVVSHLEKKDGDPSSCANVDLRTSTLKPIHAEWLIFTHDKMSERRDLIQAGFRKAGLTFSA